MLSTLDDMVSVSKKLKMKDFTQSRNEIETKCSDYASLPPPMPSEKNWTQLRVRWLLEPTLSLEHVTEMIPSAPSMKRVGLGIIINECRPKLLYECKQGASLCWAHMAETNLPHP